MSSLVGPILCQVGGTLGVSGSLFGPTYPKLAQDRPNKAGHGPGKVVLFNPDLIFLRSGLKLFEHKPK